MVRIPVLLKIPEFSFDYIDIDQTETTDKLIEDLEIFTFEVNKALYLDPYRTDLQCYSMLTERKIYMHFNIFSTIMQMLRNDSDLSKSNPVITTLTPLGISNVQSKLEDWLKQRNPQDIKELLNPKYCIDNE